MAKSAILAGKGYVELATDQTKLEAGLAAASAKLKSWGTSVMAMGAGLAAGASAMLAPFLQGLQVFSEFGTEAVSAMRMTGMAFEELDEIMDGMRVSSEELVPAVAKMSAFITEAAQGGREATRAFDALGLSIDEMSGMSQGDRVMRIADALNGIADAGRRIQLQRAVFGRGGLALNITGGAEGIRERAARADRLNPESAADVELARRYNEAMRDMKEAIKGVWMELGRAAIPMMTEFAKFMTEIIVSARQWMEANRYLIEVLVRVADKVVLVSSVVVGLGIAMYVLGTAIGYVNGNLLALVGGGLLGLALAAALIYVLVENSESFAEYMSEWLPILQRFGDTAMQVFAGIGDAIYANNWVLAMEIAWTGMKLVWLRGMNWIESGWDSLMLILGNVFLDMIVSIGRTFRQGINQIIDQINSVGEVFGTTIDRVDENAGANWANEVRRTMGNDFQRNEIDRNAAERAIERELEGLTMKAWFDRMAAEVERQMEFGGGGGGGLGDLAEQKFKTFGSFSAGAIFGALGQGEGPMARVARLAEEARQQRARQIQQFDDVLDILPDLGVRVA